jgi:hypothetical protein
MGNSILVLSDITLQEFEGGPSKIHEQLCKISKKNIKNCPEYKPELPINREYETILFDYHGRPKY